MTQAISLWCDRQSRLLRLSALAIGAWLIFALLIVTVMSPPIRLLTFGLMTGALFIVTLYEMNKKDRDWKKAVLLLAVIWLVSGVTLLAANRVAPENAPKGPLIAAGDLTPATACDGTKATGDGLLMVVGRSGVVGKGRGPFTPFHVGSCPALSITRTARGLMVNAFGYDSDSNVVYRIRDNVFEQVVGGFLTEHRPDPSTLIIGDDHGPRILEIRYLNNNAVVVSGLFHCGDSAPVKISADRAASTRNPGRCLILDGSTTQGLKF